MPISNWIADIKTKWHTQIAQLDQFSSFLSQAKNIYTNLVGVDIDASSVLCVRLSNALGKIRVIQADQILLPPDIVDDEAIVNPSQFSTVVKPGLEKLSLTAMKSAIAIPGSKVVMRQIKLDKWISDGEAEHLAWQEAKKAFPGLIRNLMLDFEIIPDKRANATTSTLLILVIARQEDVVPRIEALKQAGLTTKIVDVDYYAIARAYALLAPQLPSEHIERYTAIFNFDPQSLIFVVMHRRRMIYMNRQSFSGSALISPVQQVMTLDKSAEAMALTDEQKSDIVMQMQRLLQLFHAEINSNTIEHIILTGRCALLPGLQETIQNALNVPTIIGNPFETLSEKTEHPGVKLGPAFVLSCGLAMRGMSTWK